jgi:hypothetical protein
MTKSKPRSTNYSVDVASRVSKDVAPVNIEVSTNEEYDIQYTQVMYLGTADRAERVGAVTGTKYVFYKDAYCMPLPTKVDCREVDGLVTELGKGCARRDPSHIFQTEEEFSLEAKRAKSSNS